MGFSYIAIKQYFWNKNIVFCVIGNEISFRIFSKILFYDYTFIPTTLFNNYIYAINILLHFKNKKFYKKINHYKNNKL
jgi:hypothetical protein